MSKYKIIITDTVDKDIKTEERIIKEKFGEDVTIKKFQTKNTEEIRDEVIDCDGILNCYSKIQGSLIKDLKKCKIIARYGIGVDTIDLAEATKKGIYVTNVPDYCIEEVSDHAITLILNLVRKIKLLDKTAEKWDLNIAKPIKRLSDLTIGLIGLGKIGRRVALKANTFGFNILAFDKMIDNDKIFQKYNAKKVSFEELLADSDIISIHVPLTEETRDLITSKEIILTRKNPIIINTSRGEIINEHDLYKAIIEKKINGAGLDVLVDVPPINNPLLKLDNVIITPHTAFYSEGSIEELKIQASMEVVRVLSGAEPQNIVNREIL